MTDKTFFGLLTRRLLCNDKLSGPSNDFNAGVCLSNFVGSIIVLQELEQQINTPHLCRHTYLARFTNVHVLVSTRILSPGATNCGTIIFLPLPTIAGLV